MKNSLDFHFPDSNDTRQAHDRFGLSVEDVQAVRSLHGPAQKAFLKIFGTQDQKDVISMGNEFNSKQEAHVRLKQHVISRESEPFFYAYMWGENRGLQPNEVIGIVDELISGMSYGDTKVALNLLARLKNIPGMRTDPKLLHTAAQVLANAKMDGKQIKLLYQFSELKKFESLEDFISLVKLFDNITNEIAFVSSSAIASIANKFSSNYRNLKEKIDFATQLANWAYGKIVAGHFVGQNLLVILDLSSEVYVKEKFSFTGLQHELEIFLRDHGPAAVAKLRGVLEGGNIPTTYTGLETNMAIALTLLERDDNPKKPGLRVA